MRKPKLKRKKAHPKLAPWKQARLLTLIEEWTRYEIAARLLPLQTNICCDYYRGMLEKADEIRVLLYRESGLNELAHIVGIGRAEDKFEIRESRHQAFGVDEEREQDRQRRHSELRNPKTKRTKRQSLPLDISIEEILQEAGVE